MLKHLWCSYAILSINTTIYKKILRGNLANQASLSYLLIYKVIH